MPVDRILVVEDEALVAHDIRQHLEDIGYEVIATTGKGEEALAILQQQQADLVMMDIMLAGELDGIETAGRIKQQFELPIVFLTAFSDQSKLERARLTEPYGYLIKPFDERELKSTLAMALYKSRADRQIREGKRWIDAVLGTLECGVVTVSTGGNATYMNQYARDFLSYSQDSGVGLTIDEVLPVEERQGSEPVSTVVQKLLLATDRLSSIGEYQLVLDRNHHPVLHITFSQLRVSSDDVDGVVIAFTDITELKNMEAELRRMNTELAEVMSTRTEVLSELNRELELEKNAIESESLLKDDYLLRLFTASRPMCESIIRTAEAMINSGGLSGQQCQQAEQIASSMKGHLSRLERVRDLAMYEK